MARPDGLRPKRDRKGTPNYKEEEALREWKPYQRPESARKNRSSGKKPQETLSAKSSRTRLASEESKENQTPSPTPTRATRSSAPSTAARVLPPPPLPPPQSPSPQTAASEQPRRKSTRTRTATRQSYRDDEADEAVIAAPGPRGSSGSPGTGSKGTSGSGATSARGRNSSNSVGGNSIGSTSIGSNGIGSNSISSGGGGTGSGSGTGTGNPYYGLPSTIPQGVFLASGAYVGSWARSSMAGVDPASVMHPTLGSFTQPHGALSAEELDHLLERQRRRRQRREARDGRVWDAETGLMFESGKEMARWKKARRAEGKLPREPEAGRGGRQ